MPARGSAARSWCGATTRRGRQLEPSHLVLSPGPGQPPPADRRARPGHARPDARRLPRAPGDRLGIRRRDRPGRPRRARQADPVDHDGRGIFDGLPARFGAPGYHSLAALTIPDCLEVSATGDGEVMAVRHRERPIDGVQFHPESVLTPHGRDLLRNFLAPVIQEAIQKLLDGRNLTRSEARDVMGSIMDGEGDAGADRRVPRRATREARDRERDCGLRGGDARARPRRASGPRRPRRHRGRGRRQRARSTSRPRRAGRRRCGGGGGQARESPSRRGRARPRRSPRRSGSSSSCRRSGSRSRSTIWFSFLFAPTHHPAMRHAAQVRRDLATRGRSSTCSGR